jgi:hypothetical protein
LEKTSGSVVRKPELPNIRKPELPNNSDSGNENPARYLVTSRVVLIKVVMMDNTVVTTGAYRPK